MLSVAYKPSMLSVILLNVVMLNADCLSTHWVDSDNNHKY